MGYAACSCESPVRCISDKTCEFHGQPIFCISIKMQTLYICDMCIYIYIHTCESWYPKNVVFHHIIPPGFIRIYTPMIRISWCWDESAMAHVVPILRSAVPYPARMGAVGEDSALGDRTCHFDMISWSILKGFWIGAETETSTRLSRVLIGLFVFIFTSFPVFLVSSL